MLTVAATLSIRRSAQARPATGRVSGVGRIAGSPAEAGNVPGAGPTSMWTLRRHLPSFARLNGGDDLGRGITDLR